MSRFNTSMVMLILLAVSTKALFDPLRFRAEKTLLPATATDLTEKMTDGLLSIPKGVGDVGRGLKTAAIGITKEVANAIPTPEGLFEGSKNLLAGYPFELVSSAINKICSTALASDIVSPRITPDLNKINFQLRTACKSQTFPLLKANEIWKSADFNPKKKVVILATGWTTTIDNNSAIDTLAKAYNCRGDVNFVAVDVANFVDTLYTWSALNTDEIGASLAEGLELLTDVAPLENIHLIGHSLGAHIVGAAGRYFNYKTGKLVPRITGLDPAKPCFNEGQKLSGLLRGDAEFIDIIHSNPGVLGKREPIGDVDFYPGGLDPLQPGSFDIATAHERSWKYYAESVYPGNENNFMAKRCNSLTGLRQEKCPGAEYPMGYMVPHNIKGNYFSEVNGEKPFGKNGNARKLVTQESCGKCTQSG